MNSKEYFEQHAAMFLAEKQLKVAMSQWGALRAWYREGSNIFIIHFPFVNRIG
jgi:hypothetical protein